jgi:hypothetical protein
VIGQRRLRFANQQGSFLAFVKIGDVKYFFLKIITIPYRMGRTETHKGFWWGNFKERDRLEDLGLDGRIRN